MFHKNLSGPERLNIWRNVRQKTHSSIIDVLEEFRGLDMKIDIEPPIPQKSYSLMV